MENWLKHLFLKAPGYRCRNALLITVVTVWLPVLFSAQANAQEGADDKPAPVQVIAPEVEPRDISEADIDAEFFEIGLFSGLISIDNFSTEALFGVSAAFHATEDFFLQFNYGFADAGLTSFEELSGSNVRLLTDDDREYTYYDFLVGYNVFPGEIFFSDALAFNSAIYVVGGVGNTEFGGENNFTTTFGTGFRVIPVDWLTVHVDFRDHMFTSDLIRESQLTHNIELSAGFTLFF